MCQHTARIFKSRVVQIIANARAHSETAICLISPAPLNQMSRHYLTIDARVFLTATIYTRRAVSTIYSRPFRWHSTNTMRAQSFPISPTHRDDEYYLVFPRTRAIPRLTSFRQPPKSFGALGVFLVIVGFLVSSPSRACRYASTRCLSSVGQLKRRPTAGFVTWNADCQTTHLVNPSNHDGDFHPGIWSSERGDTRLSFVSL